MSQLGAFAKKGTLKGPREHHIVMTRPPLDPPLGVKIDSLRTLTSSARRGVGASTRTLAD